MRRSLVLTLATETPANSNNRHADEDEPQYGPQKSNVLRDTCQKMVQLLLLGTFNVGMRDTTTNEGVAKEMKIVDLWGGIYFGWVVSMERCGGCPQPEA